MATIVTRAGKGSPLTHNEVDANFENLNSDKVETSSVSAFGATLIDDADAATARTTLGLGTAATTNSTDYATAAQGALADSAVQPNDSPTFGSITVTGTVDGRDVAADGTKLDGIEAGADVTDATNVAAAGALMTSGGTMTGVLDFTGDLGRAITITNDSTVDAADISIYLGNGGGLGFDILYEGTGSGNLNAFVIVAANQGNPKELIRSNQDGIVNLPQLGATVAGNIIGHAGLDAGAVGTYALARRPGSTGAQAPFNWNSTYAGSTLRPAGLSSSVGNAESNPYWASGGNIYIGQNNDGALSGTWRAMCQTDTTTTGDENPVGVFLRIS